MDRNAWCGARLGQPALYPQIRFPEHGFRVFYYADDFFLCVYFSPESLSTGKEDGKNFGGNIKLADSILFIISFCYPSYLIACIATKEI